jgi:DNA-binding transcriptional LysR family regulator
MLPSASDLRYFIEVSQSKNISRAAERLGITQPSLSLAIRRTEDSLGTQLLIRSKSGVQLTPSGQRFVQHAKFLIDEWEKVKAQTLNIESEICGRYIIGCHPSVALYSLPGFLPQLLSDYPRLEIHLKHDHSRKIVEEVISHKIDLGIVVNPVPHPDLVITELCKDTVTLWKLKGSQKKHNEAPLIFDPDLLQSQDIVKKLKKGKFNFQRTVHTSNLEVTRCLIECDTGIGILPTRVATMDNKIPLENLPEAPKFKDRICLVFRADAIKTKAAQEIRQRIKSIFTS